MTLSQTLLTETRLCGTMHHRQACAPLARLLLDLVQDIDLRFDAARIG